MMSYSSLAISNKSEKQLKLQLRIDVSNFYIVVATKNKLEGLPYLYCNFNCHTLPQDLQTILPPLKSFSHTEHPSVILLLHSEDILPIEASPVSNSKKRMKSQKLSQCLSITYAYFVSCMCLCNSYTQCHSPTYSK